MGLCGCSLQGWTELGHAAHLLEAALGDGDPGFDGDDGVWVAGGEDLLPQRGDALQLQLLALQGLHQLLRGHTECGTAGSQPPASHCRPQRHRDQLPPSRASRQGKGVGCLGPQISLPQGAWGPQTPRLAASHMVVCAGWGCQWDKQWDILEQERRCAWRWGLALTCSWFWHSCTAASSSGKTPYLRVFSDSERRPRKDCTRV